MSKTCLTWMPTAWPLFVLRCTSLSPFLTYCQNKHAHICCSGPQEKLQPQHLIKQHSLVYACLLCVPWSLHVKKKDPSLFVAIFISEAMCACFTLDSVCCASMSVYDPDPVLAVFCSQLMMGLLYTKYICKGLDVE